jgi:hypothetical protein
MGSLLLLLQLYKSLRSIVYKWQYTTTTTWSCTVWSGEQFFAACMVAWLCKQRWSWERERERSRWLQKQPPVLNVFSPDMILLTVRQQMRGFKKKYCGRLVSWVYEIQITYSTFLRWLPPYGFGGFKVCDQIL